MSHYFINDSTLKSEKRTIKIALFGFNFVFNTDSGVFSKNEIDFGSKLLIEHFTPTSQNAHILDIGCGYGAIGIITKKRFPNCSLMLSDVNTKALALAEENKVLNQVDVQTVESNLFENINDKFDDIITNPPIRAGKKIIYDLFLKSYDKLKPSGSLWIVIRKQQGALSAIKYLETIYNEVNVIKKSKGFFIIKSSK